MNPKTDYSAWRFWFDVGQYAITILIGVYVWFINRVNARAKDLKSVKKSMGSIETRVTQLETGSISHKDLGAVYDRVNDIVKEVSNLDGKMDGVKGAVDMIQEYLLNNGGKK